MDVFPRLLQPIPEIRVLVKDPLLHTIGGSATGSQRIAEKKPTFAVLDLGGASTQIVFEPMFDEERPDSMLEKGEHRYDLTFGGEEIVGGDPGEDSFVPHIHDHHILV